MAGEKNIIIEEWQVEYTCYWPVKNILIEGISQVHLLMVGEKDSHWRYKLSTPLNGLRKTLKFVWRRRVPGMYLNVWKLVAIKRFIILTTG